MDFEATPEQRSLRAEIVEFSRRALNDGTRERDHNRIFDRDLWRRCGELKLHGLPVAVTYGGRGRDPLNCAIALEALGYG